MIFRIISQGGSSQQRRFTLKKPGPGGNAPTVGRVSVICSNRCQNVSVAFRNVRSRAPSFNIDGNTSHFLPRVREGPGVINNYIL